MTRILSLIKVTVLSKTKPLTVVFCAFKLTYIGVDQRTLDVPPFPVSTIYTNTSFHQIIIVRLYIIPVGINKFFTICIYEISSTRTLNRKDKK